MRTESVVMMIAIGLALGEEANRVFGKGFYRLNVSRRAGRLRSAAGPGSEDDPWYDRNDSYLEKLAMQYEIIPLMSKLI